ncbi:DUF302 domain-containing protein [Nocardia sp. NPDC051981]|uniref:DUF302 domain-containing protein n=1 Tax=Nocardia sp. NPDC051981 TaxID=3155417 RepID=UPI00341F9B5F
MSTTPIDKSARVQRVRYEVNRITIAVDATFEELRMRFEQLVPDIELDELSQLIATGDLERVKKYTEARTPNSFANFWTFDPTAMMALRGSAAQVVTYMVGNNLIAERMFRHDPGVMLYAPIRVAIYTDNDRTLVSFDQPSTRFDTFDDENVSAVGRLLDEKIAALLTLLGVEVPDELSRQTV